MSFYTKLKLKIDKEVHSTELGGKRGSSGHKQKRSPVGRKYHSENCHNVSRGPSKGELPFGASKPLHC